VCIKPESKSRSLTDLAGSDYLTYPLPHTERVKHLESWLREALILPYSYEAEIDANGKFVSFGQSLVEINERAVSVREGQVGEKRVKAEMLGVMRLEVLLNEAEIGDLLFLFSPPGNRDEGFGASGERRLSFSYIFEVLPGKDESKKNIRAVAIPVLEIDPQVQIEQFASTFGNTGVVGMSTVSSEPIDRKLVATPVLVSGLGEVEKHRKLTEYTNKFAGKSWDEIEAIIANGLKLKEDEWAEQRRKSLIESISWQIRRYVDEGDSARLNNIGEATRVVLAREASGHYLKMKPSELLEEYLKTANQHLQEVRLVLLRDSNANEILSGSACGGGGLGEALESLQVLKGGGMVVGRGHILEQQLASLKEASQYVGNDKMECVTCPFCSAIVDAILTPDKIVCPKCNKSASRG